MRISLLASLLFLAASTFSQSETVVLTLDECMQMALDNNIQLKIAENNAEIARSNKVEALMSHLPSIQASWNYNLLFGTFWDNIAARVVNKQFSSNPNVNASFTVFDGMSRSNGLKGSQFAYESARHDIESSRLETKNNVLDAYLAASLDRENIRISEERLELLQNQLDREIKRESVGVGNLETVYNFQSQVANERLSLTNLRNQYRGNMLNLIQLLRLALGQEYELEDESVTSEGLLSDNEPFSEILEDSYQVSPALKSSAALLEASRYDLNSSRSGLSPSVSLYGEIGSRYSSQGATNPNNLEQEKAPYLRQMDWNLYEFIGLSVDIPIFSRYQNSANIQRSKLGILNAELNKAQAEQDLQNRVQSVYFDLISAQESYKTATENLNALSQSFTFVKKRYENGNTDFYTYLESLNNVNRAEIELVNARYSIIFRKKILDLYRGK